MCLGGSVEGRAPMPTCKPLDSGLIPFTLSVL